MVRQDILDFAEAFKAVRGFYPRRVYITFDELKDILSETILGGRPLGEYIGANDPQKVLNFGANGCNYQIELSNAAVQIREWDLLSPS